MMMILMVIPNPNQTMNQTKSRVDEGLILFTLIWDLQRSVSCYIALQSALASSHIRVHVLLR